MQTITTKVSEIRTDIIITEEEVRKVLIDWIRAITNTGSDIDVKLVFIGQKMAGFDAGLKATIVRNIVEQSGPKDFNV